MSSSAASARLARGASLELSCAEAGDLAEARPSLWPAQRVYVSHLPGQTFPQTQALCAELAAAGLDPVPHVPVRRLGSEGQLDEVLGGLFSAGARELLLISGDLPQPAGPYSEVMQALASGRLQARGFRRLSLAGHPEGHPVVPAADIRRAEIAKAQWAAREGLQVTVVTQFCFEAAPFLRWARELREAGITARLVAGLAGPASAVKLLKLARHCGVGASIRALAARPSAMLKLLTDHRPDALVEELAAGLEREPGLLDGIHLFSFGGLLRTARWQRESVPAAAASSVVSA